VVMAHMTAFGQSEQCQEAKQETLHSYLRF